VQLSSPAQLVVIAHAEGANKVWWPSDKSRIRGLVLLGEKCARRSRNLPSLRSEAAACRCTCGSQWLSRRTALRSTSWGARLFQFCYDSSEPGALIFQIGDDFLKIQHSSFIVDRSHTWPGANGPKKPFGTAIGDRNALAVEWDEGSKAAIQKG
jgi:hypothetical protein